LGEHGWALLSWGLLIGGIFMRSLRDLQNALYTSISLHRGPVGERGGGSFAGTFEKKEKLYLEFLSWTQRSLRF
jgi:hypothetical protein